MAKKGHRYRVTVEYLSDPKGAPMDREPVRFEAVNHDDIFHIHDMIRSSGRFPDEDTAGAFTFGLKLLTEVMLHNRKDPLFDEMLPATRDFIVKLKRELRGSKKEE